MLRGPATETQVTHLQRLWLYILCGLVVLFLVGPTLMVVPMSFSNSRYLEFPPQEWSFRWYRAYFSSLEWRRATAVSFQAASLTMVVATVVGTLAAYGLHVARAKAGRYISILLTLPMIIPVILLAVGIFLSFAPVGLNSTIMGLVLAHSVLAIPLVLITVTAGMRNFDINQEMVARSMGASRPWAFLTITLPQIRNSALSAALLAFIVSLDEVVIALLIAGGDKATLTRRMFLALRDEIDPTIAAISTLLIGFSILMLLVSQLLQRKRD
ncbi:ABC transporter permease [Pseudohalocynthiibacter aestuariivivens]|uniref:ABC transporter permease n=1 Tax=Roseovarius pelagicus TaxID=2980108 RepID=A0ABY6DIG3_9RHOB|nr:MULTISPECIES: ABC transporter permease [Rhodobacterales]QIE46715.1 ABC transporter permease [Pseudohalocynthiibacter aestuariivivens]UXX84748.1 ABC transporter permease [Roseovarius pelagicus]